MHAFALTCAHEDSYKQRKARGQHSRGSANAERLAPHDPKVHCRQATPGPQNRPAHGYSGRVARTVLAHGSRFSNAKRRNCGACKSLKRETPGRNPALAQSSASFDGGGLNGEKRCSRSVRHHSEKKQALNERDAILGVPIRKSSIAAMPGVCGEHSSAN